MHLSAYHARSSARLWLIFATLAVFFGALAGCEADETAQPLAGSGGLGPSTLRVRATIAATGRVTNAALPDDFDTTIAVTVERSGATVPDAIVSLRRADRDVADVLLPDENGTYVGDHVGYVATYELAVEAAGDTLTGVRILMPEVHVVTAPAPAATVPAGSPLSVAWEGVDAVDEVEVVLGNVRRTVEDDPGTLELPAEGLQALVQGGERVSRPLSVTRETRMALEGGAAGSRAFASVTNGLGSVTVTP